VFHLVGRTADIIDSLDPADPEAPPFLSLAQARFGTLSGLFHLLLSPRFSAAGQTVEFQNYIICIAAGGAPLQDE
jgi:hypothetical protein